MSASADGQPDTSGGAWSTVVSVPGALRRDLAEITLRGPAARQSTIAALSVALSVLAAIALHLPDVWWAGISGFMCSQATRPASVNKGILRIIGTLSGAGLALVSMQVLVYDQPVCCLALFTMTLVGVLGISVSPHGYAWLFFSLTFNLIVLFSLPDPTLTFHIATTRAIEVVVGTVIAVVVALVLAPDSDAAPATAPGWRDLLDTGWPAVQHAARSGVAVATIPLIWAWFDPPNITTMAITMVAVSAVPVAASDPMSARQAIVRRSIQRLYGCCLGGLPGLMLLSLPLSSFVPWLIALTIGIWLCARIQASTHGIGYVGTQAGIVFLMTLVQGSGPPDSLLPGINRLSGIVLGLLVLSTVSLLLAPATDE